MTRRRAHDPWRSRRSRPARTASSRSCRTACARTAACTRADRSCTSRRSPDPGRGMTKAVSGAVALDAMGGDHAPAATVAGAIEAVRQFGVQVLLVGREAVLRRELAHMGGVSERHRDRGRARDGRDGRPAHRAGPRQAQLLDGRGRPARPRRRRVRVRHRRQHRRGDGRRQADHSARSPGVERPALARPCPGLDARDPDPRRRRERRLQAADTCAQFAVMGHFYSQAVLGCRTAARRPALDRRGGGQGRPRDASRPTTCSPTPG